MCKCKYAKHVQSLQYKKRLSFKLNAVLLGIYLCRQYVVIVSVLSLNVFKMLAGTTN